MNEKDIHYSNALKFYMRDFVSHLIGKYIEYLQDLEHGNMTDEQVKPIQETLQNFQVWLFHQTV